MSKYYMDLRTALRTVKNSIEMDCVLDASKMFLIDFIEVNFPEEKIYKCCGIVDLNFKDGELVNGYCD